MRRRLRVFFWGSATAPLGGTEVVPAEGVAGEVAADEGDGPEVGGGWSDILQEDGDDLNGEFESLE